MSDASAPRHLVGLGDLSEAELDELLELSLRVKGQTPATPLAGRTAGLLFFRPSLRTRASFETAVHQLGGHCVNMNAASDFWELESRPGVVMDGRAPEHIRDAAEVLSRYMNALAIRPALEGQAWEVDRRDEGIRAWTAHATVPVINMESALWHPLQALADLMTLRESLGTLEGRSLAIVWTHSPVPVSAAPVHSLLVAALRLGVEVRVAHPQGYELDEGVLSEARAAADAGHTRLELGNDASEAVRGSAVVYSRSWMSLEHYGNATLAASHRSRTREWIVDERLLAQGEPECRFMHAGPVRRNLEASDEVLDGSRSLVYEQAENRLHSQKALLLSLLGG